MPLLTNLVGDTWQPEAIENLAHGPADRQERFFAKVVAALRDAKAAGVAKLARKLGKRVFAFVGRTAEDGEVKAMFDGVYENARPGMNLEENMKRAGEILRDNARQLAKKL